MFNNPQLKKGSAKIFIPKGKMVDMECPEELVLGTCTPDGEYVRIRHVQGRYSFKSPGFVVIDTVKEEDIWYINYQTDDITFDPVDPIPVEAAISEAPTMMDRMRAMIQQEVINRYGENQMETLEEAMDFDIDGDGHIGSQYEIMDDEYPDLAGADTSATSETDGPDDQPITSEPGTEPEALATTEIQQGEQASP